MKKRFSYIKNWLLSQVQKRFQFDVKPYEGAKVYYLSILFRGTWQTFQFDSVRVATDDKTGRLSIWRDNRDDGSYLQPFGVQLYKPVDPKYKKGGFLSFFLGPLQWRAGWAL